MKTEEEYLKDIGLETNKDFHLSGKTIPELMKGYAKYCHQQKMEEVENIPKKELEDLWVAFGNFCKAINDQQKLKEMASDEKSCMYCEKNVPYEESILIPVKSTDELPEKTGEYLTSVGYQTFNKDFNTFSVIRDTRYWYKEIPKEEYLAEQLEKLSQYLDDTASELSHLHLNDIDNFLRYLNDKA